MKLNSKDFQLIKICIDKVIDLKIDVYTSFLTNTENEELKERLLNEVIELVNLLQKLK